MAATTILGQIWCGNLKGQTAMITAHLQFMSGLAQYIMGNVTFTGIFTGTNPTSGATITTPVTAKVNPGGLASVVSSCGDPAGGDGAAQWLAWISGIYAGITASCGLIPAAFIPFTPMPCFTMASPSWTRNDIKKAVEGNINDPQGPAMDAIAKGFMKDMQSMFVPTFAGAVGAFIGAFTVSKVITA